MTTKTKYIYVPTIQKLSTICGNRGGYGCIVEIYDTVKTKPRIVEVLDSLGNYFGNVRRDDLIQLPLTKKRKLELLKRMKETLATQKRNCSNNLASVAKNSGK